eukprot:764581-Hanusia_phi.AAC.13
MPEEPVMHTRPKRHCTERARERVRQVLEWEEAPEHGELFRAAAARVEREFKREQCLRRRGYVELEEGGDDDDDDEGEDEGDEEDEVEGDASDGVNEWDSEDSDYYPGKRGGGFHKYDRLLSDGEDDNKGSDDDDEGDDKDDNDGEDDEEEDDEDEEEEDDEEDDEEEDDADDDCLFVKEEACPNQAGEVISSASSNLPDTSSNLLDKELATEPAADPAPP